MIFDDGLSLRNEYKDDLAMGMNGLEIAIVGMAGRFPGAKNIDEFWYNLRHGVESITRFSDEELRQSGVDESLINHPQYVKAGGKLEGVDLFDAAFSGLILEKRKFLTLNTVYF